MDVLLTPAEQAAMNQEANLTVQARLGGQPDINLVVHQRLGDEPTIESLKKQGLLQDNFVRWMLDTIGGLSRIVTLLVAEIAQSIGALIIALAFSILEYERVHAGAVALGQSDEKAATIALAVVAANLIVPIYILRTERGSQTKELVKSTLKSRAMGLYEWIVGDAHKTSVQWSYNPALKSAKTIITITTLFLACYDLVGDVLIDLSNNDFTRTMNGAEVTVPLGIILVELFMGIGLSVAGVLFLQAAAHEVGVRLLTERPVADSLILQRERNTYKTSAEQIRVAELAAYNQRVESIYKEIQEKHITVKRQKLEERAAAAEARRRVEQSGDRAADFFDLEVSAPMSQPRRTSPNGHGGHDD